MIKCLLVSSMIISLVVSAGAQPAERRAELGQNAALRYWSAFAEMQDAAITDQQAKELNLILEGSAPYDDSKYKDLVEKNRAALETMARSTAFPNCDWGIDYALGPNAPVEYVRKALALGRLNVLYVFHLLINGDKDGAVGALAAGVRFSHDVANGGTLFAAVAAKSLLAAHLGAMEFALRVAGLSAAQQQMLENALAPFGPDGLDWQSAMRRELEVLEGQGSQAPAALARITPVYIAALKSPSMLPRLQQIIASAPEPLPDIIPNPKRVIEEKQDLASKLLQVRSMLQ
jgi:hypothetical protein